MVFIIPYSHYYSVGGSPSYRGFRVKGFSRIWTIFWVPIIRTIVYNGHGKYHISP